MDLISEVPSIKEFVSMQSNSAKSCRQEEAMYLKRIHRKKEE